MKVYFFFSLFCLVFASTDPGNIDQVYISCDGANTQEINHVYSVGMPSSGPTRLPPLEYEAQDEIYGSLSHNIRINGDGGCYTLAIRLRGVNTGGWEEFLIKSDKHFDVNEGILDTYFKSLIFHRRSDSLCQDIIMSRELRYNTGRPSHCQHYISYQDDDSRLPISDSYDNWNKACMFYIGLYTHNPFVSWMTRKARLSRSHSDNLFDVETTSKSIKIKWGQVKQFNCQKKNVKEIKMEFRHKLGKNELQLTQFVDTEFTVDNLTQLSCFPVSVDLKVTMVFGTFNGLKTGCNWYATDFTNCQTMTEWSEEFRQYVDPTEFASTDIVININTTVVKLDNNQASVGINCVEGILYISILTPPVKRMTLNLKDGYEVDMDNDLDACREYVIDLKVKSVLGNIVSTTTLNLFPVLDKPSLTEHSINFTLKQSRFSTCTNIHILLECVNYENENSTNFEFEGLEIYFENITEITLCRGKAFIVKDKFMDLRDWTDWFKINGSQVSYSSTLLAVFVTLSIVVIALLIGCSFALFFIKKRNDFSAILTIKKTEKGLPAHMVFEKSERFPYELENAAFLQGEVLDEFEKLEEYVNKKIEPKESVKVASENLTKNRYKDILPYDSNVVTLSKPTGSPKSQYINASWINFKDFDQQILSSQAPKKNTVSGFWQMILDNKVSVILMITELVENGRIKAHQYWPDEEEPNIKLDNNLIVTFQSKESYKGLDKRIFIVTDTETELRVVQVHCQSWPDNQVPKDSTVLLDMYETVADLLMKSPGTLLVHCSAGVGRTGAFIGLFKLIKDLDAVVPYIDPFYTVVEMRRARRKMVQKPIHYYYIIKCLSDYVLNGLTKIV